MQHFIFAVSYAYFVMFYLSTGEKISAPLIAAPVLIYAALSVTCLALSRIMRADFIMFFKRISPALYFSLVLFLAPLAVKFQIPDPHNFTLRKLELILAAAYVLTLAFMAFKSFVYLYRSGAVQRVNAKKAFIYLASVYFIFFFFLTLRFNQANEPTGDEPAYLMTAHSIVHDRDLDISNNFANKDYKRFYSRELVPQGTDIEKNGRLYSYHPVFYSLLISPFYLAGGRFGVTVFSALMAAVLAALIYLACLALTGSPRGSFLASVTAAFSLPLLMFTNIISTELVSAAVLCAAYLSLKKENINTIIFSLLVSALFWVHIKNAPLCASLALLFFVYSRKKPVQLIIFTLLQALFAAGYFYLNYSRFGSLLPPYSASGGAADRFTFENIRGLLVYFLDRQQGLLFFSPVFLLSFAGAALLAKYRKQQAIEAAVLLLPYLLLITSWDDWGTGSTSPRYFVQIMFILAACIAMLYSMIREKYASAFVKAMAAYGFVISCVIAVVPWFRWDKSGGENWILSILSSVFKADIAGLLPSFKNTMPHISVTLLWVAVVTGLNIAVFFLAKSRAGAK